MNATARLIQRCLKAGPCKTQAGIAKWLGVTPQAVSNWMNGVSQAEPHTIEKLATHCGENPREWMARVESERAHKRTDRETWARVYAVSIPGATFVVRKSAA